MESINTYVIVGLGNPGEQYVTTRHNAGFIILDYIADKKGLTWQSDTKFDSEVAGPLSFQESKYYLLKPQKFMNLSGDAVAKFLYYYKINPSSITVINDDVDLSFGVIKKQTGAGSAGHKGVEDIINKLGTKNFSRIRIGVGRSPNNNISTDDWVLLNFSQVELSEIKKIAEGLTTTVFN